MAWGITFMGQSVFRLSGAQDSPTRWASLSRSQRTCWLLAIKLPANRGTIGAGVILGESTAMVALLPASCLGAAH